jgi:hypothetical protein
VNVPDNTESIKPFQKGIPSNGENTEQKAVIKNAVTKNTILVFI